MNKSIFLFTIRQLFHRPVRWLFILGIFVTPLLQYLMLSWTGMGHEGSVFGITVENSTFFAFAVGAGVIGQDLSDGILPLILSRPLKRWRYVLSKYVAIALLASGFALLNLACLSLIRYGLSFEPVLGYLPGYTASILCKGFGVAAVMLLLSSLVPGLGDIGIIVLIHVLVFFLVITGEGMHIQGMTDTGTQLIELIYPSVDVFHLQSWRSLITVEVGRYLTTLALCLTGAVLLVNQKELSYGSN